VAKLSSEQSAALQQQARQLLPAEPIEITATAWAVTGRS
jgi:hypothetical protein